MIIGYARVSTEQQNLDAQLDALEAAGVEKIYSEKITGKTKERPELKRMLEHIREGDVVVVSKIRQDGAVPARSVGHSRDHKQTWSRISFSC